jgi:hypothetical protein
MPRNGLEGRCRIVCAVLVPVASASLLSVETDARDEKASEVGTVPLSAHAVAAISTMALAMEEDRRINAP